MQTATATDATSSRGPPPIEELPQLLRVLFTITSTFCVYQMSAMRQPLSRLASSTAISTKVPRYGCGHLTRPHSTAADKKPATASLSPRWLSDLQARIGKCIMFGCSPSQSKEAGSILQEIAQDWRGLVAGSEGFLTDPDRAGLYRRGLEWGEMVRGTLEPWQNIQYWVHSS